MYQAAAARRSGRRACAILGLIAALFAAHRWTAVSAAAPLPSLWLRSSPAAGDPNPFRLGTAASPFGWSTAIGDLNADGRPDYAVADRIGRGGSGFEYAVELSIAGVGSRSVNFDAPDEALTVSLRDVDHDHDLDVVVTALVSHAVVRVWLNDGAGQFHEATSLAPSTEWQPGVPQADGADSRDAETAVESTPRRIADGLSPDPSALAIATRRDRLIASDRFATRRLRSVRLRSRGPPPAAASTLA